MENQELAGTVGPQVGGHRLIPGLLDFSTPKFKEQSENVYENKGQGQKVEGVEALKIRRWPHLSGHGPAIDWTQCAVPANSLQQPPPTPSLLRRGASQAIPLLSEEGSGVVSACRL